MLRWVNERGWLVDNYVLPCHGLTSPLPFQAVTAIQKSHPVFFHQYLHPFLCFFNEKVLLPTDPFINNTNNNGCFPLRSSSYACMCFVRILTLTQLHALAPRNGVESQCDGFLIECCAFLGEGLSCRSYRVDLLRTGIVSPSIAALGISTPHIMAEFWSDERIIKLCELCLQSLLPLTTKDVESWEDDPEAFFLSQDSLLPSESLRVAGEQVMYYYCNLQLFNSHELVGKWCEHYISVNKY